MQISKPLVLAALMLATSVAQAATLTCSGKVTQVILHADDMFMMQLDSMNTAVFFCTPHATWAPAGAVYSTRPETCRAMIAIFLAAKAQGSTLSVVYFDGNDVPAACNAWAYWKSANIRHFTFAD